MDSKNKEIGNYVASKILQRLSEIAKLTKKTSEKPKIFLKGSDNQSIDKFYIFLLECLAEWAQMFPF